MTIYSTLTDEPLPTVEDTFARSSYEQFKAALADTLIEALRPIRERYLRWPDSPDEVVRHLQAGANRATTFASATLRVVYERVGFFQRQTIVSR